MSTSTLKRGTAPRRVQPKRKAPPKPSIVDRMIGVLPISEAALRRTVTWTLVGAGSAAAVVVATWFGIPGMVGNALAEGVGRAGFRVEQVEVTGIDRMERMSVYAVALDQKSRAMPLVDLDGVRERLLRYGWIADAQVSRRLPDTLLVHIVERKPAAVWQNAGQLMLIDGQGVLLEPVSADAMPDLPLVIGEGAETQEPAYQALIAAAPALRPMVKAATWIGNRRWDLLFESGETLMLPEGEGEAAKALVKFAEMDGADRMLGKGWARFDMRDQTRMVVKKRGEIAQRTAPPDTAPAAPAQHLDGQEG